MEVLSDALQPYKSLVGTIAGLAAVGQMFSGTFLCYDAYKQKNTRGISIVPFVGGFVISILNLKYGFILRDDTMIQVNFVGLALNIIYLMIYFNYTEEKMKSWAQMGLGAAFTAALMAYAQYEDPALIETRFGTIITALMFYLISAPMFSLGDIIKNQSTEGLPFPLIMSSTIVTFMWLLYGIILKNQFLVIQNVVAFALCASQLSLFVIYPTKPKSKQKAKSKKAE